jgi:hypothetical protein
MARDVGRRLVLRRYFSYDLVPRRVGTVRIPEVRIPYFDPASRRYQQAVLRGSEVRVTPAATAGVVPAQRTTPAEPTREEGGAAGGGLGGLGLAAALGATLALVGFGLLWRWRTGAASRWRKIESGLDQAEAAREAGEHAEASRMLGRLLRTALETRVPGARALSAEEILERAADDPTRKVAERLVRLERERFQPGAATLEETPSLRGALAELRRSRPGANC